MSGTTETTPTVAKSEPKQTIKQAVAAAVAAVVLPEALAANAEALKAVESRRSAIVGHALTIRVLHGRTRDTKVQLGRECGKLKLELETAKLDKAVVQDTLIALCGTAPNTGKPYEWSQVASMITGTAIVDTLPEAEREAIGGIGIDSALALKRIPDADLRRSFFKERVASGESMAAKPLREAAEAFLVEGGFKSEKTDKARTASLVDRWKDETDTATTLLKVDRIPASVDYADAIVAVIEYTAKVLSNGKPNRWQTEAIAQMLFPSGRPKRTPKPRSKTSKTS